ncbi:MAG: hypothetical protein HYZ42_05455 [Bacteroidetes bacterium]|nr:hypothetical protein [Bacteroidota bacterium]
MIANDSKKVEYWADYKILYIRMPSMSYTDRNYYAKQIAHIGKGKQIDKVIIDVRYNGGGSDFTWLNALRTLGSEPFRIDYALYGNDPSYMTRSYKRIHRIKKYPFEVVPYLSNHSFYPLLKQEELYKPFSNSIKVKCKIIAIGNDYIYSAGGSLFKALSYSDTDSFYSIGTPTGTFLGSGFDPIIFELPNSKIKFSIAPAIDLSGCKTIADVMQDQYDFVVLPTLNDFKIKYEYKGNIWDKEFLIKYDPYIRKALEL